MLTLTTGPGKSAKATVSFECLDLKTFTETSFFVTDVVLESFSQWFDMVPGLIKRDGNYFKITRIFFKYCKFYGYASETKAKNLVEMTLL